MEGLDATLYKKDRVYVLYVGKLAYVFERIDILSIPVLNHVSIAKQEEGVKVKLDRRVCTLLLDVMHFWTRYVEAVKEIENDSDTKSMIIFAIKCGDVLNRLCTRMQDYMKLVDET